MQLQIRCPIGIEDLLEQELLELGARIVRRTHGGIFASGSQTTLYRICMWSRLASRVLLHLASVDASSQSSYMQTITALPWEQWLNQQATLRIKAQGTNHWLHNSHYGTLCCKDAIIDRLRDHWPHRPPIDKLTGNTQIQVFVHQDEAHLWLDVGGGPLFHRNLRILPGSAALHENLAAALLLRAGFVPGQVLLDPMCGTGIFLLEAALMMVDQAPGLLRQQVGWLGWQGHTPALWQAIVEQAQQRRQAGLAAWGEQVCLFGLDQDPNQVALAQQAFAQADLSHLVHLSCGTIETVPSTDLTSQAVAHLLINPPFGERLETPAELPALYQQLGAWCRHFPGATAHVLLAERQMGQHLQLRASSYHAIWQGKHKRCWLHLPIDKQPQDSPRPIAPAKTVRSAASNNEQAATTTYVTAEERISLLQRLGKNLRQRLKLAKQQQLTCFRLYDADIPQFSAAIDVYNQWLILQEYAPPANLLPAKTAARRATLQACLAEVMAVPAQQIIYKMRGGGSQQGGQQPLPGETSLASQPIAKQVVQEGPFQFWVDIANYLDTGLFLDQRLFRQHIYQTSQSKHVLNLFGYTGTASVAAARGGAASTTTVDWSNTYLQWATENFQLNKLDQANNYFIAADVRQWLSETPDMFDSILLGPPSFSRSKRSPEVFILQEDHPLLIEQCMQRLQPHGTLYFITHARNLKLADELQAQFQITSKHQAFCPIDFRQAKIPLQLFAIQHKQPSLNKP